MQCPPVLAQRVLDTRPNLPRFLQRLVIVYYRKARCEPATLMAAASTYVLVGWGKR